MCCESKKYDSWGGSTWQPQCRQAGGSGLHPHQGQAGAGRGQRQKLAWLTGPGGVRPGQSRTPGMLHERLLKERQLMAPETEHQKASDAKPRRARFTKDGRGPLGSAGRVRFGWLWDPTHPSRLQRSTQEAHESSRAEGLDAGAAGISSRSALWCTTTAPKPPPPPLDPHPVTSPHHGTADGRRGEGLLSASWPPAPDSEKGVLGTAASASLAASPPPCSTGKVSGHLWASPTPARAAGSARNAPAPSPGDQTEPRRLALRWGAGPAGGAWAASRASRARAPPLRPGLRAAAGSRSWAVWAAPPGRGPASAGGKLGPGRPRRA